MPDGLHGACLPAGADNLPLRCALYFVYYSTRRVKCLVPAQANSPAGEGNEIV